MPSTPHTLINSLHFVAGGITLIVVWYLYQIGSRKKERLRYKIKRTIVALLVYLIAAVLLVQQRIPPLEAVTLAIFIGFGFAWLLVTPPKHNRRIPKSIRQAVIARDLTSKGVTWNPQKHHIDHVVPFSRGGDHSLKNLRVVEKQRNLQKGGRMPNLWDFLRK